MSGLRSLFGLLLLITLIDGNLATKCTFCNKEFTVLGRHTWRCKSRITSSDNNSFRPYDNGNGSAINNASNFANENNIPINRGNLNCVCGKVCKGKRGLKSHQRSCRTIRDLGLEHIGRDPAQGDATEEAEGGGESASDEDSLRDQDAKKLPGLKLPKTVDEWAEANLYFQTMIYSLAPITDISARAKSLQSLIYNYFAETYGTVKKSDPSPYDDKYKHFSVKQLKKSLAAMKMQKPCNDAELKWLSTTIRSSLKERKIFNEKNPLPKISETDLKKNFWSVCKKLFNKVEHKIPAFTVTECGDYFKRILSQRLKSKFDFPSWIPSLPFPKVPFDDSPPSYQEMVRVINKCKSSSSPCPLDHMSVIILKKVPIIRTLLHELIVQCWLKKDIPTCWKNALTVLIYKKGEPTEVANFRPITLQPVFYKILSSIYRNRLFTYLQSNNYIDKKLQKGFWPGCEGISEHTNLLTHIMTDARLHQRSLTLCLLDLRNAFGEVSHSLIRASLNFHHVPTSVADLFNNIYKDTFISVAVNDQCTAPIKVKRGVLQGDPCSPLLFNLCFNPLMLTLKLPKYSTLGYLWSTPTGETNENSWLQFADDAIILASNDKNAQIFLNIFSAWCKWAQMEIRLDKCSCYGMRKENDAYDQYNPQIFIDNQPIPVIQHHESFTYLGKYFNFGMNGDKIKEELKLKLKTLLTLVTNLQLKPQSKIKLVKFAVYPKLNFALKMYDFGSTWIKQELDSIVIYHIRHWLELPISTCVSEIASLPKTLLGLDIPSLVEIEAKLKLTMRNSLKNSQNEDIKDLWTSTSYKYVASDSLLQNSKPVKLVKKELKTLNIKNSLCHVKGLQLQGFSITAVIDNVCKKQITLWSKYLETVPSQLFIFVRKAIVNQLPTRANLKRWGKTTDSLCPLCGHEQSNKHVLNNCSAPCALERFKIRHDTVLLMISHWINSRLPNQTVFADLPQFSSTNIIFDTYRPDLAIIIKSVIIVMELTICHETNLKLSGEYKKGKYRNLNENLLDIYKNCDVKLFTVELSALGFIVGFDSFCNYLGITVGLDLFYRDLVRTVSSQTYNIYRNRDKT